MSQDLQFLFIYILGVCAGCGVMCILELISDIRKSIKSCDFGHKLPKLGCGYDSEKIFIELDNDLGPFDTPPHWVKLYSYCERCGKKVYYPGLHFEEKRNTNNE